MSELIIYLSSWCTSPRHTLSAKAIHCHLLKLATLSKLHLATRILVAYFKCRALHHALQLFDEIYSSAPLSLDLVSWNSVISGCVQNHSDHLALFYFKRMQSHACEQPLNQRLSADSYTLSSILSSSLCMEKSKASGQQFHGYSISTGIASSLSVCHALITFYCAWDQVSNAQRVFDAMPQRNALSWTALISGYTRRRGKEQESLRLFVLMLRDGAEYKPNQFTLASAFGAYAKMASLSQGMALLALALKMGHHQDRFVQNSLLGFYAECGCLEDAVATFATLIEPDIVSWNSLLKAYSQQGRGKEALRVFDEMCRRGATPDSLTFVSVLSACSHSGMTAQGLKLYRRMEREYGLKPGAEHVSCIVSLLGRAGRVQEAELFIRGVEGSCNLGESVWRTLLGSCRVHGDVKAAELAVRELMRMEPCDSEAHVVLTHVYGRIGKWQMVRNLRQLMKEKRVEKEEPGCSWIEVRGQVHSFVASDSGHYEMHEILMRLKQLANNMKDIPGWQKKLKEAREDIDEASC